MTILTIIEKISRYLAVFAVLLCAVSADAAMYEFTNIADSSGEYWMFGAPSINDHGVVAFATTTDKYVDKIQTWDDGKFSTLYDSQESPSLAVSNRHVKINNSGTIAFLGRGNSHDEGFYTGNGGPFTTIAARSGDFNSFGLVFSFNDSGRVAFQSSLDDGSYGVFTGDGGPITTIAHTNQGFDNFGIPAINDLGAVAYVAESGDNSFVFYQEESGPRTTLLEGGDPNLEFGPQLVMNNLGQVVVYGLHFEGPDDWTCTLSIASSEGVTPLADCTGPFACFYATFSVPGINNNGEVAFLAGLDNEGKGIFTGPDATADRLVVEGDTLFGGMVEHLHFWGALNDSGQIAFRYELDNGIEGIAIATPVPEPTALGLLAFGSIALSGHCCQRRKTRS